MLKLPTPLRVSTLLLVCVCPFLARDASRLRAADGEGGRGQQQTFRSRRLVVHTDLSTTAATSLLQRMESALDDMADYWDRPLRGTIECFVVADLPRWPDSHLPHPMARLFIGQVGGAAIAERIGTGRRAASNVRVFASSLHGVAEHEIVHAYCGQTFGATGPLWYQEGMAQLFAFGVDESAGANCPATTLQQLKSGKPKTLAQIVHGGASTRQLASQFKTKARAQTDLAGLIPANDWDHGDIRALADVKQFYAWNWFLCHLLYHNPNYRSRFRKLGEAYLTGRQERFQDLFGPVMRQLVFEYRFALQHLARGYRADLCHWDWDKSFGYLNYGRAKSVRVAAARGYQPTGVVVERGRRYRYRTSGTWTTARGTPAVTADGHPAGGGRLEAVIFRDQQLSAPVDLGASGRFRADCGGQLFVRCRDDWGQLGDNSGSILLTVTR